MAIRKTMREIRLEERTRGFYDCLVIFEDMWRKRIWEKQAFTQDKFDETCDFVWNGILKAQGKIKDDEWEYKKLSLGRRGYDIDEEIKKAGESE